METESGSYLVARAPISYVTQFGYSIGHILNDLCSACWFTYLIIYLNNVQGYSKDFAGVLVLIGQLADGLATPVVGILIDKINTRYGKRKTFHAIGTVCVAAAFAFVFHKCLPCTAETSTTGALAYYAVFIILFQFGWASTQIAHLSLIPVLTVCKKKIVFLNSVRSGLTFVCGIAVYLIMWLLLHNSSSSESQPLGPGDDKAFSSLSFIVIGIGLAFSILFHVMVKESSDTELREQMEEQTALLNAPIEQRTIRDWFKIERFYLVGLMYMFTRLAVNVPQVYLPLYLTYTLELPKESIAYYPLMMLICSVIGSLIARVSSKYTTKKGTYVLGSVLVVGACVWFYFQGRVNSCTTYGATALIGAGTSMMLVMSLSMTADLIGVHTNTGAFVYGAMSLLDKISNGVVIALIQHFNPDTILTCPIAEYYRVIMTAVPGTAAVFGTIVTIALAVTAYVRRSNARQADNNIADEVYITPDSGPLYDQHNSIQQH